MADTPEQALTRLRQHFERGLTEDLAWREQQLAALESLLLTEEEAIGAALRADLGKPAVETMLSEVLGVRREVRVQRRHLRRWTRPRRARLPLVLLPARGEIRHVPLGVVLVVSPWNYPVNLVLVPLAAAIAAGNCVVVKPSELAPRTSALLAELLPRYLDGRAVAVCEGGAEITTALIDGGVDHVFFTGSPAVGRLVMGRAAVRLTPVTLELGGKSPAYVDRSANLEVAARRLVWGKFMNAGQTCIAPDYLLADEAILEPLLGAMTEMVRELYGEEPRNSPDYGRIVDDRHFARLESLLATSGGRLVCGGEVDRASRYFAPSIITDLASDSPLMAEEIFGPLLPVLGVADHEAAIAEISARPVPLCAYVFAQDKKVLRDFTARTRSGSICTNTVLEQFAASSLPFGGLGPSGTGHYHGRFGLETFSHLRPVLAKARRPNLKLAYPPYSKRTKALLRRLL